MSILFAVLVPLLGAALLAFNLLLVLRAPDRVRHLGRWALGILHRQAEKVELWRGTAGEAQAGRRPRSWHATLIKTKLGIWSLLASFIFLARWLGTWGSPRFPIEFTWNVISSWLAGVTVASALFGMVWACGAAWRMGLAELFAGRNGLSRIWIARACRASSEFGEALRDAFAAAPRIELLDFTGFELLAKGSSDEGGVIAALLSRFPDKEARILLFNPCAKEIDPDRKQTTVLQSQLGAMELSREAFESKLRATMERIDVLNRNRQKPIEVRLYSEKPSFRVLAAGEVSFLGAIDPRDAAGEFPFYEARRQSEGPSLHAAARSHFLRVWGDSMPVTLEATSQVSPAASAKPGSVRQRKAVVA